MSTGSVPVHFWTSCDRPHGLTFQLLGLIFRAQITERRVETTTPNVCRLCSNVSDITPSAPLNGPSFCPKISNKNPCWDLGDFR